MKGLFTVFEAQDSKGNTRGMYFRHFGEARELNLNDAERHLALYVAESLVESGVNADVLSVERRSDDYATLTTCGERVMDLMRFKVTPRVSWACVPLTREDAKANMDNPLFAAQRNKKQLMWKCNIESLADVDALIPFIVNRMRFVELADPTFKGAFVS